jgi:hypothetical protein
MQSICLYTESILCREITNYITKVLQKIISEYCDVVPTLQTCYLCGNDYSEFSMDDFKTKHFVVKVIDGSKTKYIHSNCFVDFSSSKYVWLIGEKYNKLQKKIIEIAKSFECCRNI